MSTRACYTFKDQRETFHVYKHHDGYPTGAANHIARALPYAWPLPRFEAADMAAAFVAANKTPHWLQGTLAKLFSDIQATERPETYADVTMPLQVNVSTYAFGKAPIGQGGGAYLMPSGSIYAACPADIEYRYEITQAKNGKLHVKAWATSFWKVRSAKHEKLIISCPLDDFATRATEYENKPAA